MAAERTLVVGRISGLFGVQGWVKVFSETEPMEAILGYSPWRIDGSEDPRSVEEGRRHGKGLIARLEGCGDRDQASALVGSLIRVNREQLPPLGEDEFYWADLQGLTVVTPGGLVLGKVDYLFETPGNDVLVVRGERERLIPFIWEGVVKKVDLEQGRMIVDWDPDF